MNVWNEYTIASIFIQNRDLRTLSVGIWQFMMQNTTDWASMSAAATIAIVPAFSMIIFAQKYLVGGMTTGSVKGQVRLKTRRHVHEKFCDDCMPL